MSPLFTKKEPGARKSGRLKSRNYEMVELTLELRFFFFLLQVLCFSIISQKSCFWPVQSVFV